MLRWTGLGVTGNPATYSDYFNGAFFCPIETALCDLALSLFLQLQQVGQSLETCYARWTYPKILSEKIPLLLTAKKIIIMLVSKTLFLFKAMLITIG